MVVVGMWLGKYHPAGFIVAAVPILIWLGLLGAQFAARLTIDAQRGRVVRERLAALRAEGFSPQLVCEGDLARGDAWAAFDSGKGETKILSADAIRSYETAQLGTIFVDEARRLGDPTPLYYSIRLAFFDANGKLRPDASFHLATSSRSEADRWAEAIRALKEAARPPGPLS